MTQDFYKLILQEESGLHRDMWINEWTVHDKLYIQTKIRNNLVVSK